MTDRELKRFYEAHDDIPKLVSLEMLLHFKEHVESHRYGRLISAGKLWRARRRCDGCKAKMPAGEARHLFRHEGKYFTFKSYFVCPTCEWRWEALGDAGVPNCLADKDNWALWEPEPIDPNHCGDCLSEFAPENPAVGIPTTSKGPIFLLCGSCAREWEDDPYQTPGLQYTVLPVAGGLQ